MLPAVPSPVEEGEGLKSGSCVIASEAKQSYPSSLFTKIASSSALGRLLEMTYGNGGLKGVFKPPR